MKKIIILKSLVVVFLLSSCATIISGSRQKINISSTPSAATVFIDGTNVGITPIETKVRRKSPHQVEIKLDGYKTYEVKLTKSFNGWYLANIFLGGIVGLVIDPITGAMYNLSPRQFQAQMAKGKGTAFNETKDKNKDLHIAVTLDIDPSWKKVGQLEKI